MPHLQCYPEPDAAVATDALAVIVSGGGYENCCDLTAYRPLVAELLRGGIVAAWSVQLAYIVLLSTGLFLRWKGGRWMSIRLVEPARPSAPSRD